jgi:hypothetical protein
MFEKRHEYVKINGYPVFCKRGLQRVEQLDKSAAF